MNPSEHDPFLELPECEMPVGVAREACLNAAGGIAVLLQASFLDEVGITRVQWAQAFQEACEKQGIEIRLEIIPGLGHQQTEQQNVMSRNFMAKELGGELH